MVARKDTAEIQRVAVAAFLRYFTDGVVAEIK